MPRRDYRLHVDFLYRVLHLKGVIDGELRVNNHRTGNCDTALPTTRDVTLQRVANFTVVDRALLSLYEEYCVSNKRCPNGGKIAKCT